MIGAAARPIRRPAVARPQAWRYRPASASAPAPEPPFAQVTPGVHPLGDAAISSGLRRRADEIATAFAAIEPALSSLAPQQFESGFVQRANAVLAERIGITLPLEMLAATWLAPLDMRTIYARAVLATFCRLVDLGFDRPFDAGSFDGAAFDVPPSDGGSVDRAPFERARGQNVDGESAQDIIQRFGFHAIDITPCSDGRLSGVLDYILRVPPGLVVALRSYAGAMFDVEETLRRWEAVELRRWREGQPNSAQAPTRYLKIGVYHFSSGDPEHEGCAAHGSDAVRAANALLERLEDFELAVARTHCCEAAVAVLLVGVDTDTDAIRVHVPDRAGRMSAERFVDNRALYEQTRDLPREEAKSAIRDAVAACAGVATDDAATEGMRWLCGYLLKNNIGQVDAVRAWHGGAYADRGHTERLIVVGDPVDDVQLRNLAFQAQMDTVEEGAADLDVGVRILSKSHAQRGLAVPVLVHARYDPRIPGAERRARERAERLRTAIVSRYASQAGSGRLHVEAVVRAGDGTPLSAALPATAHMELSA
jgi:carboxysome shell carbonic anhydrase